jgi:predicted  nucleic acid-binding Zn-ribbon protein
MPVCLKCGWEIIIGPGGCACTQAARRQREMEEASKIGKELAEKLGPVLDEARRVAALPPEEQMAHVGRLQIQKERADLVRRQEELRLQQDVIVAHFRALQRKCKHPKLRKYSAMGEIGDVCDDCGYQT